MGLHRTASVLPENGKASLLALSNVSRCVDCGLCTVELRDGSPKLPDLAQLDIKMSNNAWKGMDSSEVKLLLASLDIVLQAHVDFNVTFDFRLCQPTAAFTEIVANFFETHRASWAQHAKTMALLIRDNIFVAATNGSVGRFIKACLPGCPTLICHDKHAAQEFFQASATRADDLNRFVSVADLVETPQRSKFSVPRFLASLAPFQLRSRNMNPETRQMGVPLKAEPTLHVLPNGDVRVIQSPGGDLLLASSGDDAPQGTAPSGSDAALQALAALKLQGSKQTLIQLVGAHFHVAELVIDAEVEAMARNNVHSRAPKDACVPPCWAAIELLFDFVKQGQKSSRFK
eukprot:CAMPEP_0117595772 /NCGR_PEP_ID=MMETSP0784-20121206/73942_1 /TAXON_ID=39447 /ORGANISM="" /LENGTH=344 /DNA_ID=CAMNT_0005397979 /DNA_START=1 /DNA_END=1035 /DNA_ORIENTATION=+